MTNTVVDSVGNSAMRSEAKMTDTVTKLEWRKAGSRHLAFPYQIVLWGNHFQVWRRAPNSPDDGRKTPKGWTARYTVIAAGFAHLDDAKARAQAHADSTECAL